MQSSLDNLSFFEQRKLDRAVGFATTKYHSKQAFHEAIRDAIPILEARVRRDGSREWVFWYMLSDWYSTIGEHAKAVRAAEKCFELNRRDARSHYALATELRMLTHARLLGRPGLQKIQEHAATSGMDVHGQIDPQRSQQALDELGLTIDAAAERSLNLFEGLLELGIDLSARRMVCDTLASMYSSFPHLEDRRNAALGVPMSTPFKFPNNPFEEAARIYDNLKEEAPNLSAITGNPDRYRARALEVIRLSQRAIQVRDGAGDAYMLLASAYYLACTMSQGRNCTGGYSYCNLRGSTILFEWEFRKKGGEQQAFGESMLTNIRDEWAGAGLSAVQIEERVQDWRNKYLSSALGPNAIRILSGIL